MSDETKKEEQLNTFLTEIGDAIREAKGITSLINARDMAGIVREMNGSGDGEDITDEVNEYTELNDELETVINSLPDISEDGEECNGQPLEVNELPAVGVEGTFYKVEEREEVNQLWMYMSGQGSVNLSEDNLTGIKYSVEIVEDYPDNPIPSTNYQNFYLYYIPAMNNLYLFNTQEWTTLGEFLGAEFAIYVVDSPDKFTEDGMYIISSTKVSIVQYLFENGKYNKVIDDSYKTLTDLFIYREIPREITLPSDWETVPYTAFIEVPSLIKVTIPNRITRIDAGGFNMCENLREVIFEEGSHLRAINTYAFAGCKSLESIEIPNGVTYIDMYAFRSCDALRTFTLQSTTPPALSNKTFHLTNNLTEIRVPMSAVDAYKSATNWSDYADIIVGYE